MLQRNVSEYLKMIFWGCKIGKRLSENIHVKGTDYKCSKVNSLKKGRLGSGSEVK